MTRSKTIDTQDWGIHTLIVVLLPVRIRLDVRKGDSAEPFHVPGSDDSRNYSANGISVIPRESFTVHFISENHVIGRIESLR